MSLINEQKEVPYLRLYKEFKNKQTKRLTPGNHNIVRQLGLIDSTKILMGLVIGSGIV